MLRTIQWSTIGWVSLAVLLATPSLSHAHGMGLDEMAPPVVTAILLGLACYWLIVLWPASRSPKLPAFEPTEPDTIRIKQKPRLRVVERRLVND